MATNSFSQEKLRKYKFVCDGCSAHCELGYHVGAAGYWPTIANRTIYTYRDNEYKGILEQKSMCKTELDAVKLARYITGFCDHYTGR